MKKGTFFSILALLVSIVGITVAVAAYMKRRHCVLCDDIDEDMFTDDDCDCCDCEDSKEGCKDECSCGCEEKKDAEDHPADCCAESAGCCEQSDEPKAE